MNIRRLLILVGLSLILKSALFGYAVVKAPEIKIQTDSHLYLQTGKTLAGSGVFGRTISETPGFIPEYYRTPGYPIFLGIFHDRLGIPLDGVVFIQIILTLLAALMTLKAAEKISSKLTIITAVIVLFDPAITIYSLMLLTESLFLVLMSGFLYMMVSYIKENNLKQLCLSAVLLAGATYVRPITIYLGLGIGLFLLVTSFRTNLKSAFFRALIFVLLFHGLLLPWQWRNHRHFGEWKFSQIDNATVNMKGLYKSYERNEDPYSQGLPPLAYYVNVSSRNLMSLLTRPASLKNFNSDLLKKAGKVFAYPWIVFWIIGFVVGITRIGTNISAWFLLLVIVYLGSATIIGAMWGSGPRFRVPMMPYIAILSSLGWYHLIRREKIS